MTRLPTLSTVKRAERLIRHYKGESMKPMGGIYRDRIYRLRTILKPHYDLLLHGY